MTALPMADVRPLPARKLSASEARDLANLARVHAGVRGVARELLMLLLRHPGGRMERGYGWLTRELACDRSTVIRAMNRLRTAGLVVVDEQGGPGSGRNTYRVQIAALSALGENVTEGEATVHPGDFPSGETPLPTPDATSGETPLPLVAKRHHPGGETPLPNARAGTSYQNLNQKGPHTRASQTSPASVATSPAASDRGPSLVPTTGGTKCPHGRTPSQGGCRPCGTNTRAQLAESEREQTEARRREARRREERRREAERAERDKGKPMPKDFDWRAAIGASHDQPTKEGSTTA